MIKRSRDFTGCKYFFLDLSCTGQVMLHLSFLLNSTAARQAYLDQIIEYPRQTLKDIYPCPIEIIKKLTDKGQFQYLTKRMGPQSSCFLHTKSPVS